MQSEIIVLPKEQIQQLIYQTVFSVLEEFQNKKKPRENMNKKEAADYLRITVTTIDRRVKEGKIKACKLGGRVVFEKQELDRYRDSNSSSNTIKKEKK